MKQFNGYEDAKKAAQFVGGEKLPKGAYVCEIKNVQYQDGQNGNSDIINVLFDVVEGDYKDFFRQQYDANSNEDKKWKGRTSIFVPKDDGSEKDGWTKNAFAKWTDSFEKSNSGYVWDWDENKWKGKKIGLVFRDEGNVIDGKEVVYTAVAFPVDAQLVRDGKAPEAKFKARNGWTGQQQSTPTSTSSSVGDGFMDIPAGIDEDVPFN